MLIAIKRSGHAAASILGSCEEHKRMGVPRDRTYRRYLVRKIRGCRGTSVLLNVRYPQWRPRSAAQRNDAMGQTRKSASVSQRTCIRTTFNLDADLVLIRRDIERRPPVACGYALGQPA